MFEREFSFPGQFEVVRLGMLPIGTLRRTHEQRVRAQVAAQELRVQVLWGNPEAIAAAQRIYDALDGITLGPRPRLDAPWMAENHLAELVAFVQRELESGRLIVVEGAMPLLGIPPEYELAARRKPPEPEPPPRPKRRKESEGLTFYEVRFVDEVGQAIVGFEVEFELGGGVHAVTTNAAGVALLENVTSMSASIRVASAEALQKLLDPRWCKPRQGSPPAGLNKHLVVFTGASFGAIAVKPAVPNTIVIQPPLGKLFVELFDKNGRVRHRGQRYESGGTASLAGKTDDEGRLVHEGVFPGEYELRLHVEFDPGDGKKVTDTYKTPLVVLSASATEPQRRLLGVAPRTTLARLRSCFNTNKAFLLPTALPSLRQLSALYLEHSTSELLVVGHADTAGGPDVNDALSLQRAEATIAFLRDDVDGWLRFYESGVAPKQRWGAAEDRLMQSRCPTSPVSHGATRPCDGSSAPAASRWMARPARRALLAQRALRCSDPARLCSCSPRLRRSGDAMTRLRVELVGASNHKPLISVRSEMHTSQALDTVLETELRPSPLRARRVRDPGERAKRAEAPGSHARFPAAPDLPRPSSEQPRSSPPQRLFCRHVSSSAVHGSPIDRSSLRPGQHHSPSGGLPVLADDWTGARAW